MTHRAMPGEVSSGCPPQKGRRRGGLDRDRWAADLESTNRADYLDPGRSLKNPYKKEIAQDHRSNHFEFGDDVPDMVCACPRVVCYVLFVCVFRRRGRSNSHTSPQSFHLMSEH